jgi:hypothetical protein
VRMLVRSALVVVAIAVAAPPASAQAVNDVRCLLVSNLFAKAAKDPKAKALAEASKYYYLGKLQGRVSPAQLKTQAIAQAKTVNAKDAGPFMNDCAKQLQSTVQTTEATLKQAAGGK